MLLSINGEILNEEIINQEVERLRPQYYQVMQQQQSGMDEAELEKQLREWARENAVEQILLRQDAVKNGDPIPQEELDAAFEEVKQQFGGEEQFDKCMNVSPSNLEQLKKDIEGRLKTERVINELTAKVKEPKQNDIAKFYRDNQERFKTPEMVNAAHIVKHGSEYTGQEVDADEAGKEMLDAQEQIKNGTPFEELADKFSDCAGNGGQLGWFPRGEMVEEFEDIVFKMQPDEISEIFTTPFGQHIVKLYEKKPEGLAPLSEVKEPITQELMQEKKNKILEDHVDKTSRGSGNKRS